MQGILYICQTVLIKNGLLVTRDLKASKRRFGQAMARLNKAWNLAKASNSARELRDDIKLYQALHGWFNHKAPEESERAIETVLEQARLNANQYDVHSLYTEEE